MMKMLSLGSQAQRADWELEVLEPISGDVEDDEARLGRHDQQGTSRDGPVALDDEDDFVAPGVCQDPGRDAQMPRSSITMVMGPPLRIRSHSVVRPSGLVLTLRRRPLRRPLRRSRRPLRHPFSRRRHPRRRPRRRRLLPPANRRHRRHRSAGERSSTYGR